MVRLKIGSRSEIMKRWLWFIIVMSLAVVFGLFDEKTKKK